MQICQSIHMSIFTAWKVSKEKDFYMSFFIEFIIKVQMITLKDIYKLIEAVQVLKMS
jgi:hypothetical protein